MASRNNPGAAARFPVRKAFRAIAFSAAALALSNCTTPPPAQDVTVTNIPQSAVISSQTQTLTPEEMSRVSGSNSPDTAYLLGPSDIISTQVYLNPSLSMPPPGAPDNNGGVLVTADGNVILPLVGSIHVGGLTLAEAQQTITQAYAKFIDDPNITLQLVQAQSLRYYLLGSFTDPGVKYPQRPLTLLEAMALGGSADLATSDLYQAYVVQGTTKLPVDLHALLAEGDMSQNIMLASNDIVVIPSASAENAYFFGAVGKPGPVSFPSGHLSLLQGLSGAGLDLPNYTAAGLSNVHIIRSNGATGQFIVVNADAIMQGKAASFDLQPGDVVFVPATPWASWNQVMAEILPTLQVINNALDPFVSIKYLTTCSNCTNSSGFSPF